MGLARRHAPPRRRRLWSVLTRKPYKKGAAKIDIYYAERGYYMRQCSLLHLPCLLMTRLRIFWLPTRAASPSPGAADGHRRDNSALVRESCCECAFRCSPPRAFRARPAVAVTENQRPLIVIASGAKRSSLHACLHARSVSIARAPPTQCELLNAACRPSCLDDSVGTLLARTVSMSRVEGAAEQPHSRRATMSVCSRGCALHRMARSRWTIKVKSCRSRIGRGGLRQLERGALFLDVSMFCNSSVVSDG
jgi:hypothetical protein